MGTFHCKSPGILSQGTTVRFSKSGEERGGSFNSREQGVEGKCIQVKAKKLSPIDSLDLFL
jgi:hypothetical protein